jgi:predicted type IV restriction endonuclease
MPSEADARIVVDRLLRDSGWDIEDKSQVSTEEASADGRADYLSNNRVTTAVWTVVCGILDWGCG